MVPEVGPRTTVQRLSSVYCSRYWIVPWSSDGHDRCLKNVNSCEREIGGDSRAGRWARSSDSEL